MQNKLLYLIWVLILNHVYWTLSISENSLCSEWLILIKLGCIYVIVKIIKSSMFSIWKWISILITSFKINKIVSSCFIKVVIHSYKIKYRIRTNSIKLSRLLVEFVISVPTRKKIIMVNDNAKCVSYIAVMIKDTAE